ncbi:mitochondrial 37S ribosomal protein rsm10 [Coemansia sp. RSA 1807]|nr:mitochondrial 37S ribosomal protein rsm10 [Coemansia sp. RSA 921]KAJ2534147.1 mitochondrial 37S ribosomal protein rsm10 [Coemansia sp. RSA 1937]KAJ2577732.1 mitochondrial 37S ribosomal protein rsm10 [Coemansia sp. RSA 1807]
MIRSAAARGFLARTLAKPALVPTYVVSTSKPLMRLPSGTRFATTYTKMLDKVLGINVHEKTQVLLEDPNARLRVPKQPPTHGIPMCRVAFHSFQLHRMDFFTKWCCKAAFHMKMPCSGVIFMPRKIRRWTVLKSPFVHKSSQEVFERRTYKRVVYIYDSNPEVVQKWLDYIGQNAVAGVGMKYWLNEYEPLDIGERIKRALKTGDTKDVDAVTLKQARHVKRFTVQGRKYGRGRYRGLPMFRQQELEKMAMYVADQLRANPQANIEELTKVALKVNGTPKRPSTHVHPMPSKKKLAIMARRAERAKQKETEKPSE